MVKGKVPSTTNSNYMEYAAAWTFFFCFDQLWRVQIPMRRLQISIRISQQLLAPGCLTEITILLFLSICRHRIISLPLFKQFTECTTKLRNLRGSELFSKSLLNSQYDNIELRIYFFLTCLRSMF